jgi:uncharacterized SAM-binding protein YcdF (DUF218 family)
VKRRVLPALAIFAVGLGVLYLAREPILFALGDMLVYSEAPVHADAIVVVGGDYSGNRVVKAAQLVKDGYAPYVLVSGAAHQYGFHESNLAIDFAVSKGYPRETMVPVLFPATSTAHEAVVNTAELRKRGAHSYILVTSFSHTARARRLFRQAAPDLEIHTVGAPQPHWHRGRWWPDREGRKIWTFEVLKTLAAFFGI